MKDLGTFEEVGYADIIRTGKSREEMARDIKRVAKMLGIKVNIKHTDKFPKGKIVWDVRTGRVSLLTE